MPKYLAKIDYQFQPKNRLHKAVLDMLLLNDRTLIDGENLEAVKKELIDDIERLEREHKMCKPLRAQFYEIRTYRHNHNDWGLDFGHGIVAAFRLYYALG